MSGRVRACSSYERIELGDCWELAAAAANLHWSPATVPGTVASALRQSGEWSLDTAPRRFDAEEWWYRARFAAPTVVAGERVSLVFEGLATLAAVRLNGHALLDSDNMFVEQRCDVTALLLPENELLIRFASLDDYLSARRPRPRWRTPMVQHQQLRWVRTSLLGRTPGWSPPAAPLGPWRPVWLERRRLLDIGEHRLQACVVEDAGRLTLSCSVTALQGATLTSGRLFAERNGRVYESDLNLRSAAARVEGILEVPAADLWWPHTHGEPALYAVSMRLGVADAAGGEQFVDVRLGQVGFRTLRLERETGGFALHVNGREIFCRGAVWTPLDCVSLQATGAEYDAALAAVCAAGMNMLRVAGPLVYESDEFLDRCDAAGILLWQDFMFANMDYPTDQNFLANVRAEARQQLFRLQARPSLALLCGNSEGAQQAAMSGAARDCWAPPLFEEVLAVLSADICPDVSYCASSTHGGAFPFQPASGVTSYYGVGAYLLPLDDARRSGLRFASECLAFANVPENETLALLEGDRALRCHQARWKERSPRDLGAGWDFDDVRDHYLGSLFRVDVAALRYGDHDRYLRLARTVSGEVMAAAFAEWRRARSACGGALVWFLSDLWPGAGWGVIDSTGLPKAAYYHLKRVLQPQALFITDEGTNGLAIHVANDTAAALRVRLELQQYRLSQPVGRVASAALEVAAGSVLEVPATDLYEGFVDLSYAYRFGPVPYDVLHARLLREADGAALAESFYFPRGLPNGMEREVGLSAVATKSAGGALRVVIQCRNFAQSVHLEIPGFVADDQYFHMAPGSTRTLDVRPRPAATSFAGTVHALNAAASCRIAVAS